MSTGRGYPSRMRALPACLIFLVVAVVSPAVAEATGDPPRIIDTLGLYETNISAHIPSSSKPAWVPESRFVVGFSDYSPEDVVLVQWKAGAKAIGKPEACVASTFVKEASPGPGKPALPVGWAIFDCRHPAAAGISKAGKFSLELSYKQTLANTRHALGTLEFEVIQISQGALNKQVKTWIVSQDHRLAGATIEERVQSNSNPEYDLQRIALQHHDAARQHGGDAPFYTIRFWTKYKQGGPTSLTMACLLDGKKVLDGQLDSGQKPYGYWTYRGKEKDNITWEQRSFQFSTSRAWTKAGENAPGLWMFDQHPGEYRCVATAGGEIVKEVWFKVDKDGAIAPGACQSNVTTPRHVHLLKSKDAAVSNVPVSTKGRAYFRSAWRKGCPERT